MRLKSFTQCFVWLLNSMTLLQLNIKTHIPVSCNGIIPSGEVSGVWKSEIVMDHLVFRSDFRILESGGHEI